MTNKVLLCHPRSGSNWFFSCLVDIPFTQQEVFGAWNLRYKDISPSAIFSMMSSTNKFYKVHFFDIHKTADLDRRQAIIDGLQTKELYFLTRRNVKKAIVSFAIALNNKNFLRSPILLIDSFTLTEKDIVDYYDSLYGSIDRYKHLFNFKEEFVYEDLIDGIQRPQNFNWDPTHSRIKERVSMNYLHLIKNWDQVEGWIDQLPKRP